MALNIAVFASGNGSNFQAIVDAKQAGKLDVNIELLVCDKPQAKVVERARLAGIEAFVFTPKNYENREAYEAEILELLYAKKVDLIVLAGYMRIITSTLVDPFFGKMINVHPSMLPSFPGINAMQQALDYGVKVTGVTVHYVDGGLDSGPIIAQEAIIVDEGETEDTLAVKTHAVEQLLYPKVIGLIADGKVNILGRTVKINN